MAFEVSGKSEKGVSRFKISLVMVLSIGLLFVLFIILSEGFNIFFLLILLPFLAIGMLLRHHMKNASKVKTIIIEDEKISYFYDDELKTNLHLKDITKIRTQQYAKDERDGFLIWKGEEIVLMCGGLDDLDLPKLIQAFNEIIKYKERYKFKVIDDLKWEGKKSLNLREYI